MKDHSSKKRKKLFPSFFFDEWNTVWPNWPKKIRRYPCFHSKQPPHRAEKFLGFHRSYLRFFSVLLLGTQIISDKIASTGNRTTLGSQEIWRCNQRTLFHNQTEFLWVTMKRAYCSCIYMSAPHSICKCQFRSRSSQRLFTFTSASPEKTFIFEWMHKRYNLFKYLSTLPRIWLLHRNVKSILTKRGECKSIYLASSFGVRQHMFTSRPIRNVTKPSAQMRVDFCTFECLWLVLMNKNQLKFAVRKRPLLLLWCNALCPLTLAALTSVAPESGVRTWGAHTRAYCVLHE